MKWKAELIEHRKAKRIAVWFERNQEWTERIKKIKDAKWSNSLKVWHLPDNAENRVKLKIDTSPDKLLLPDKLKHLNDFVTYLSTKRYSQSTIKSYTEARPSAWLFEGQQAGSPYDERSLASVLKQALKKAGIKKDVSLH